MGDIYEARTKKYNQDEAEKLMGNLSCFKQERQLLKKYDREYLQYGIESHGYSKGLMVINSYMILNGQYGIKQTIVTDNLENKPLVILTNKYTLKSLQQFLISSESAGSIFGEFGSDERNIEISETEVIINDKYLGKFTRINHKNNDNSVYAEKYKPGVILSNWELERDNIFAICSTGELEILYRYGEVPVFVQVFNGISEKSLLERGGYNPNSSKDARKFVEKINEEVDLIVNNIDCEIKNHKNSYVTQKKLRKIIDSKSNNATNN